MISEKVDLYFPKSLFKFLCLLLICTIFLNYSQFLSVSLNFQNLNMMMDVNVSHLGGGFGLLGHFNYEKYGL